MRRSPHGQGVTAQVFWFGSGAALEVTFPISPADSALVFRVCQLGSFQMKLSPEDVLQEHISCTWMAAGHGVYGSKAEPAHSNDQFTLQALSYSAKRFPNIKANTD